MVVFMKLPYVVMAMSLLTIASPGSAATTKAEKIAFAGGPARLGDNCWRSPETVGEFLGNPVTATSPRIDNIAQVVRDSASDPASKLPDGYEILGWLYHGTSGPSWYRAGPGDAKGYAAGILTGSSLPDIVAPITNPNVTNKNFDIDGSGVIPVVAPFTSGDRTGKLLHTIPCFSSPWDGRQTG